MGISRDFTLTGNFRDEGITRSLDRIEAILERQTSTIDNLNRTMRGIQRPVQQTNHNIRGVANSAREASNSFGQMANAFTQGALQSEAIQKVGESIVDGIRSAIDLVGQGFNFIKDRFIEGMNDETGDYMAQGSLFGALRQEGLLGADGWKEAQRMQKTIETDLGRLLKESEANTDKVIGYSRSLNDNTLPVLMKSGTSFEDASKMNAKLYEKLALTDADHNQGRVAKGFSQLLQGNTDAYTIDYWASMKKMLDASGYNEATNATERYQAIMRAMDLKMPDEAVEDMKKTISAGYNALKETILSPTVGIFSFAIPLTEFKDKLQGKADELGLDLDEYDSPIKIIGKSLTPFLKSMAELFSKGGALMGHVALAWEQHVAPIIEQLTQNFNNLKGDVETGKRSFAEAIGRALAEIIKYVTKGFADTEGESLFSPMITEFIEGFQSLGLNIDWEGLIKPKLMTVGVALLGILALPSIITGISAALLPLAISGLGAVLMPVITTVGGAILSVLGAIGVIPLAIIGIVAGLGILIYKYRDEIASTFKSIGENIKTDWDRKWADFSEGWDQFVSFVKDLFNPAKMKEKVKGWLNWGDEDEEKQKKEEERKDVSKEIDKSSKAVINKATEGATKITEGTKKMGDLTKTGFTDVKTNFNTSTNLSETFNGILKETNTGVGTIDETQVKVKESIDDTKVKVDDGMTKINESLKKVESAINGISSGGSSGGSGGGSFSGGTKAENLSKMSGGSSLSSQHLSRGSQGGDFGAGSHGMHSYPAVDFALPQGTPIAPVEDFKITAAKQDPNGYGDYYEGNFNGGPKVLLAHLSARLAKVGEIIPAMHIFAKSGGQAGLASSGRSSGPHLHIEPNNRSIIDKFKVGYEGWMPKMYTALIEEMKYMPKGANPVIANDSEVILNRAQASMLDKTLKMRENSSIQQAISTQSNSGVAYQARINQALAGNGNNQGCEVNITVNSKSVMGMNDDEVKDLGYKLSGYVVNKLSSELQSTPLWGAS